jgi:hypothetical protein
MAPAVMAEERKWGKANGVIVDLRLRTRRLGYEEVIEDHEHVRADKEHLDVSSAGA